MSIISFETTSPIWMSEWFLVFRYRIFSSRPIYSRDLAEIRKIIKRFTSWWIVFNSWSTPQRLQKCHDILKHAMQTYLLLIRCSIHQPPSQAPRYRRYAASQRKSPTGGQIKRTTKEGRPLGHTFPKTKSHPTSSATSVHSTRIRRGHSSWGLHQLAMN